MNDHMVTQRANSHLAGHTSLAGGTASMISLTAMYKKIREHSFFCAKVASVISSGSANEGEGRTRTEIVIQFTVDVFNMINYTFQT